jgi:hypothetical protein
MNESVANQLYTMYLLVALNLAYPLITLSMASIKSFSEILFLLYLIANIPASVQTLLISAPVVFGHILPINSNLMSLSKAIVLA